MLWHTYDIYRVVHQCESDYVESMQIAYKIVFHKMNIEIAFGPCVRQYEPEDWNPEWML